MSHLSETDDDAPNRLYLLGPFRLEVVGQPVALPTRKAEALLAYLALHPAPAGHSREKLAALFWGDSPDTDARRSLRVALTGLRKALGADPFSGDRDALGLAPTYSLWVDARAFQESATRFLAGGAEALAAECAALYRGDLLADFYDDWLSQPREHLRGRYQAVLRALADQQRGRGDYAAASATARRHLDLDPTDEVAHQQLILCYLAQGERLAARQQYEACVRVLRDELGVPPSSATEALLNRIKEAPPDGLNGRPMTAARRGNVSAPLTALLGRQEALADLAGLLRAPAGRPRLVTLTGAGGNGKTRLAQEVGRTLAEHFRDGAWWVDLVPLTDAALIAGAVARVFGLPETPAQSPDDALLEHLRDRQALLILDNCEHLVAGAAALAVRLLSQCPETRIIATSREALGVPGEQVYPLAPLPVPAADHNLSLATLADSPAVALFIERAASHQPGFRLTPDNGDTIASICRRLDGIPLALELAAARVSLLSVEQIAARLDDRFRLLRSNVRAALPRQQTLQALMDWSYDLLTMTEQAVFRRLAVFAGGWTLEAAETVCADLAAEAGVLDLLGRLAQKSLIVVNQTPDGVRYGFLETILAYARRRLADPAEAEAAAAAHLACFLALAERIELQLRGRAMFAGLAQLEREQDNLRNALAWALAADADAVGQMADRRLAGLRLAAALELFWYTRGYGREGRRWLAEALARAPADTPPAVAARAHAAAGTMAWLLGDFGAAATHHETALAGYRAVGDDRGAAWALGNLGVCANERGDHGAALVMYVKAAELARSAGARWERALILNNWSAALIDLGRSDEAIPLLEAAASLLREAGDEWAASHPTLNLVEIATRRGEFNRAQKLLTDLAALAGRLGVASLVAAVRLRQGALHLRLGQPAVAADAYRASLRSYVELADRAEAIHALEGLALALAEMGDDDRAARLLAAAETSRAGLGAARQPAEAVEIARCLARLRERLGAAGLAAAQAAGRHLTLENALAGALF
jgi:predicted ATPase/DNA-binding SARP family transcriptional activator